MTPYICLSHAAVDREVAARFSDMLARYGFRVRLIDETTEPTSRTRILMTSTVLLLLCSPAVEETECLSEDLRRALERGHTPICVDLDAAPSIDAGEDGALLCPHIPYPTGDSPDRHAVGLFVHRLFISRLAAVPGIFSPGACADDPTGVAIRLAARVHAGDSSAAYALGCLYETGEGVPVLESEAAHHIAAAAAAGLPDARLHLGELYLEGRGVDADPAEAFRLFSLSAEADDLRGEYRRGLCYLLGRGVIKDPARAVYYLRRAARFGYPPALYRLGLLCRDGLGTGRRTAEAIRYLSDACRRAAGEADPDSTVPLPDLYRRRGRRTPRCVSMRTLRRRLCAAGRIPSVAEGIFAVCRATRLPHADDERRDLWLPPDATHGTAPTDLDAMAAGVSFSVSDAAVALGHLLECGGPSEGVPAHPTRAAAWYRYAADLGHAEGYRRLGDLYRRGVGVPPDRPWAARLYRMAALRGDHIAAFTLAVCLERGIGVAPDMEEAVHFYEQAANAGYAPAQNNLGGCYEYGKGVSTDPLTAVEWYVRAADAGLPDALCRLGLCYECGRGVETDLRQAFRHYETAARRGHGYALYRLGVCYDRGIYPEGREPAEDITGRRPLHSRAVELWEAAGARGVPEASYALAMSYAVGRGVRRDVEKEHAYLRRAAAADSIQAHSRLGFAYLEGRGCAKNDARARASFARAAALWQERRALYRLDDAPLSTLAVTPEAAAGAALYMEGYCILAGIGEATASAATASAAALRSPERLSRAAARIRASALLGYVGALEMLGDLYAWGVLSEAYDPETDPLLLADPAAQAAPWLHATDPMIYYREAARIGATRHVSGTVAAGELAPGVVSSDSTVHALMSMAKKSRRLAETLRLAGDIEGSERAWREIWRSFAAAAEQGSADALVGMAECVCQGYGMAQNRQAAKKLLELAEHRDEPTARGPGVGQRIIASLWLGDLLRSGLCGECRLEEADDAYLCALATPPVGTEGSPYILEERRRARLDEDRVARAEVCYRLATFRSIYFSDDPARRETFPYLAEAVLTGHAAARADLARMYAYESNYAAATAADLAAGRPLTLSDRVRGDAVRRRRKKLRATQSPTARDGRPVRAHHLWMSDYYTALWPEPRPFVYELRSVAVPSEVPAYVTVEVTPAMTASALNYLGDCYFYGEGLPADPAAAVACYREAVGLRSAFGRGIALPPGLVWAQYSLGFCLLYGQGTRRDPREAVKYLTAAARSHAEAAYTLGACYERGEGVDVPDAREAIKYYRKAHKLGLLAAEDKVEELEEQLYALTGVQD